jgi:hypothetical protein
MNRCRSWHRQALPGLSPGSRSCSSHSTGGHRLWPWARARPRHIPFARTVLPPQLPRRVQDGGHHVSADSWRGAGGSVLHFWCLLQSARHCARKHSPHRPFTLCAARHCTHLVALAVLPWLSLRRPSEHVLVSDAELAEAVPVLVELLENPVHVSCTPVPQHTHWAAVGVPHLQPALDSRPVRHLGHWSTPIRRRRSVRR